MKPFESGLVKGAFQKLLVQAWAAAFGFVRRGINQRGTEIGNQRAATEAIRDALHLLGEIEMFEEAQLVPPFVAKRLRQETFRRNDIRFPEEDPATSVGIQNLGDQATTDQVKGLTGRSQPRIPSPSGMAEIERGPSQ